MSTDGCVPLTDAQRVGIEENLDLCRRAAVRFSRKCGGAISREEFLSDAYLGLIEAAGDFDESRGVPLHGFAKYRVEGSCLDLMRRAGGRRSRGLRSRVVSIDAIDPETGRPYADFVPDREHPAPLYSPEDHDRLARSLARLANEYRLVLARQYGVAGLTARTRKYVAARTGTYARKVHRDERVAIEKLRRIFDGSGVAPTPPPRAPRSRVLRGKEISLADARFSLMSAIVGRREDGALCRSVPLDEMLAALPPVRRLVIEMRYGLDGRARPLREIGRELQKSYSTIYKAHRIGIQTLCDRLKETHH